LIPFSLIQHLPEGRIFQLSIQVSNPTGLVLLGLLMMPLPGTSTGLENSLFSVLGTHIQLDLPMGC
jgi:hypothetical protein